MISIPKRIEYSLVMISFLSKNSDNLVSLSEMSTKLYLPYRFLGQLAIKLKNAKIISGKEGKGGGYRLSDDWDNRTVYDVFEALGENKRLVECLEGGNCDRHSVCRMVKVWQRMEDSFVNELKKIKLTDL